MTVITEPSSERPEYETTAIGGWIKGAELVCAGEYLRLEDCSVLNHSNIKYFEDYRTRYFFDKFIYGQGMENVFCIVIF